MKIADYVVKKNMTDGLWYWIITIESTGKTVRGNEGFTSKSLCETEARRAIKYLVI